VQYEVVAEAFRDLEQASGRPPVVVTGWTGPWPTLEHWWDAVLARRRARVQMATADGRVDRGDRAGMKATRSCRDANSNGVLG
jgi:hypothetical protein